MPEFVEEDHQDNACFYVFLWRTSAACVDTATLGGDCAVRDKLHNYAYDLSQLTSSTFYSVELDLNPKVSARMNICGAASECTSGDGVCVTDPYISLGTASKQLISLHGDIMLIYNTTTPCGNADEKVTSNILFVCDLLATPGSMLSSPKSTEVVNNCNYIFEFPTSLACPPLDVASCSVTDPDTGYFYDLSTLRKAAGSYHVRTSESASEFYLNGASSLFLCCPWAWDRISGERDCGSVSDDSPNRTSPLACGRAQSVARCQ